MYKTVKNFPKEHKYSLGNEMIGLAWECLDLTILVNNLPNEQKKIKIENLSVVFDKLKMRLRMGQEINLLSVGQFSHINEGYLLEIGKEIGGWLKWAKKAGGGGDKRNFFMAGAFGSQINLIPKGAHNLPTAIFAAS
ncbi:MAG: hypothetical protein US47_C0001G0443 [Candidatus Moranbacteria bacterium GW2011_GWE1_37_24]|nr:MAG: hypothetical protein US47_C0001G0443 [Candidatus Moranbacteria bacterium GW2011_GWE1_37_24]